jgi:hypothetical protein
VESIKFSCQKGVVFIATLTGNNPGGNVGESEDLRLKLEILVMSGLIGEERISYEGW